MAEVVTVARARPVDALAVAELFDRYRQFYGAPPDIDAARRFMSERLFAADSVIYVARLPGTTTSHADGFAQLLQKISTASLTRDWILNDLYVEEASRRKGVASAMMREAERFARRNGAAKLTLKTHVDNEPARALYETHGWHRDEDFCTYVRTLREPAGPPG